LRASRHERDLLTPARFDGSQQFRPIGVALPDSISVNSASSEVEYRAGVKEAADRLPLRSGSKAVLALALGRNGAIGDELSVCGGQPWAVYLSDIAALASQQISRPLLFM
jgi:hypothetical protein